MGCGSVVIDLEPDFEDDAKNLSTGELILMLKSSFRDADFAKVESILTAREAKLKEDEETLEQVNEWLKYKLELSRVEKMEVETELKKVQQMNSQLREEKIERERKAEKEIEFWRRKYVGLETRISKLDADLKLLSSTQPNARVSSENDNNALELETGFGNRGVVEVLEENADLATANEDRTGDDNQRPPSRSIVQLSDSDDDCASGEILSRNDRTFKRIANSDCSNQTSAQCRTGVLKRKQASCPDVSRTKNSNNDGVEDENVGGNSSTADRKITKLPKLVCGNDGSLVNHCSDMAVSSRSNSLEKFCTPSSQEPVILRIWQEKKMGAEHASQYLTRESLLDVPDFCNTDDSSSSSSSSFASEDEVDIDYHLSQLIENVDEKKWESEAEMLAAFGKDVEWYLKAVCALYRQQTAVGKSPRRLSSSNSPRLNHFNALWGTTLAEFLVDGDPQGKLKKSVSELLQYDPRGLDDCKKIAFNHSKQLFDIYQKKEDPLFS